MATFAAVKSEKYWGEGGNAQQIFTCNARLGWNDVKNDVAKHAIKGYTQFDYVQSLGAKMEGQARRVLENFVELWDHTDPLNPNVVPAAAQELLRVP